MHIHEQHTIQVLGSVALHHDHLKAFGHTLTQILEVFSGELSNPNVLDWLLQWWYGRYVAGLHPLFHAFSIEFRSGLFPGYSRTSIFLPASHFITFLAL